MRETNLLQKVTFKIEDESGNSYEKELCIFYIGPTLDSILFQEELLSALKDIPGKKEIKSIIPITNEDFY